MDFFTEQDKARANSSKLVFLFLLAVACIIGCLFSFVSFVGANYKEIAELAWSMDLFLMVALSTMIVVGIATLFRIYFLSGGGKVVAESLGGKVIQPNTSDPLEKRILNLVEEMAIASGTPVPPVYLLAETGINAFAAGYSPADAVIGITRGCVKKLNRDQLQGVIAHEFSHILNGDMRMNIRLSGIIFGIVFLAHIGRIMMNIGLPSRHHRRKRNEGGDQGGMALIVIGGGLVVIGLIGGFFGSLLKAAVSRQREFLADASAVQFTRNPEGIAGALKRIGGLSAGSKIQASQAGEYSHFFFCSALSSMFATHPPLPIRIRRIEPNWSNEFPDTNKISERTDSALALKSGFAGNLKVDGVTEHQVGVTQVSTPNIEGVSRDSFIQSFKGPQRQQIQQAKSLLQQIPTNLLAQTKEPSHCRCILFSLLLDAKRPSIYEQQIKTISLQTDEDTANLTRQCFPKVQGLSYELKYILVEECALAFSLFSAKQVNAFNSLVNDLILADNQIDLFEWSIQKMIESQIVQKSQRITISPHGFASLKSRLNDCKVFLGALAHFGSEGNQAAKAFEKGFRRLDRTKPATLPLPEKCMLESMNKALPKLAQLSPLAKRAFLEACAEVVEHDGVLSNAEIQIIRGLAAAISCPLGPTSVSQA
ncbi:MAG: M48 family metallopeptidase [Opitutales bacterium]|nr:M48 family metallopeptidase [Opitutales bacterium]